MRFFLWPVFDGSCNAGVFSAMVLENTKGIFNQQKALCRKNEICFESNGVVGNT
jgi:hypothetical protein